MKVKVVYIISQINKALSFEWTAELIDKKKIELSFILLKNGDSDLEKYLLSKEFKVKRINYRNKTDIPKAILYTSIFLLKERPQIVHTHLFDANIVGLLSAKLCGIKKRIYTRHHSSYHHDYFPRVVKYDKLCNNLSTTIIAITNIVKDILEEKEKVSKDKIRLIHHGFKLSCFRDVPAQEIDDLRGKYLSIGFYPVIGVISRYTEWKGVQYIIPAFKKLLVVYPKAKLILANATGDYTSEVKELLSSIPSENYVEIKFENNLFALYRLFDLFVHVPINKYAEAFGQTYIESLISEVPLIATKSGIGNELLEDRINSIIVDYENSEAIYEAMLDVLGNEDLRKNIIEKGKKKVENEFNIARMIDILENLYLEPL